MKVLGLVLLWLLPATPAAAAWTEPRGQGLAIPGYWHYVAGRQLDRHGHGANRRTYVKDEFRLYAHYGLRDAIMLGFDGAARRVRDHAPGDGDENLNWNEAALFTRLRLHQGRRTVLSVQPLVRIPGSDGGRDDLGRDADKAEAELRALYGINFDLVGWDGFAIGETAHRHRFGHAADQIRADGTFGLRPLPRLLVLLQAFNTLSLRAPGASAAPNYDLHKIQISAVRDVTPRVAIQLGAFVEYAGRNTGAGQAGFVTVWLRF